jgi:uncharacterized protein (UPF0332 family)
VKENSIFLSKHRLQRANEHYKAAELLFNSGFYHDSLGRSYYAMFAAARALLAYQDLDSKKHSGVISLFNQNYVKTGVISRNMGKSLSKARIIRESSDYTDFYLVSKEEASSQLSAAKEFISEVDGVLKDLIIEGNS